MGKIDDIMRSIAELSPAEIAHLRARLDELQERLFDDRIARDAEAGKLEKLADEAIAEHAAGKSRKL